MQLDVAKIEETLKPLQRKAKLGSLIVKLGIFLFIGLFVYVFGSSFMGNPVNDNLIVMFIPVIIFVVIIGSFSYTFARKDYVKEYKKALGIPVLNSMFPGVKYYPERGFQPVEFKKAHLIAWRPGFHYCSEDLIEGVHRGVEFRQADVNITHTTGSGKNRRTVTDVDGRIWEFTCPRQVHGNVLIVKDKTHATLDTGLNKVEMEDIDFNDKFDVYAEDSHSAFYVLTPHFMEYVKSLYWQDNAVYINFDGEKLYFMQSGKGGIFEPSDKTMNVRKEIEKAQDELLVIDKIIDALQIEHVD